MTSPLDMSDYQIVSTEDALLAALADIDSLPHGSLINDVVIGRHAGDPVIGGDTHYWTVDAGLQRSSSPKYDDRARAAQSNIGQERLQAGRRLAIKAAVLCMEWERAQEAEEQAARDKASAPDQRVRIEVQGAEPAAFVANDRQVIVGPGDDLALAPGSTVTLLTASRPTPDPEVCPLRPVLNAPVDGTDAV